MKMTGIWKWFSQNLSQFNTTITQLLPNFERPLVVGETRNITDVFLRHSNLCLCSAIVNKDIAASSVNIHMVSFPFN